jgi:hypothetical protein
MPPPFFRKIYKNYVKIVEHETVITFFFFILEPLFKLSVSKLLKKQNKTKYDQVFFSDYLLLFSFF